MKKIIFGLLSVLLTVTGYAQSDVPGVIPKPNSMQFLSGSFRLTPGTAIYVNSNEARPVADLLKERMEAMFNVNSEINDSKREKQGINIIYDDQFENEAYQLTVEGNSVSIRGSQSGIFYGLQTFLQLMPAEVGTEILIPNVKIDDKPRFAYRGAMLDVGRYFFPTRYIKRFIDLMAFYKLNTLHFHLTEDAGWRIEIKKYPKLTEIGAWRQGTQRGKPAAETYDRLPHGGYYTQEEIRELVAYAREKQVTIVPEIDLPGHTLAMLAAYPELSCTGGPFRVLEHWGIQEDVLCLGNEDTYRVVEDILEEVIALFPSPIIHIGGDEAPKERWSHCQKCQALLTRENMKDERELQSYFTKRMASYLESKGRRLIGWDEILEGGIAANAMVMSWRGEKGGIAAAQQKHEVVMSPSSFLYLDYYQGNPKNEPFNIGGDLPLEKVYGYEPYSDQLKKEEQKYIVGVQGNLWMEFIHGEDKLEYMGFPRLIALAEIGWSAPGKDYAGFTKRLKQNLPWLDRQQVNYRIPEPYGLKDTKTTDPVVRVTLEAPVQGATILYTLNGDDPLLKGISYSKPIELRLNAEPVEIKCVVRTWQGRVSGTYTATYTRVNAE